MTDFGFFSGSFLSFTDDCGASALDLAAEQDESEACRLLVLHGADCTREDWTEEGLSIARDNRKLYAWQATDDWLHARQRGLEAVMRHWVLGVCAKSLLRATHPIGHVSCFPVREIQVSIVSMPSGLQTLTDQTSAVPLLR